jgi:NTE family protein
MRDDVTIDLDARHREPRTAFVLAGGATRGASQVGMLQALTERGIRPDLVVGTSIGALNGACYAETPTLDGIARLEGLWYEPPRADIFSLSARSIAQNIRRRRGYVLDNRGLRDWIQVNTSVERLEDFTIPLHAVATDAATREPVVLSSGSTVQTLLASSAIPGVFPAIEVDGRTLIDGGASADVPVVPALGLGATTIYVLPTSPDEADPPSFLWQLLDRLFGTPAAAAAPIDADHVEVHRLPAPRPDANPTSFRASRRLVAESLELARTYLDGHRPTLVDLRDHGPFVARPSGLACQAR